MVWKTVDSTPILYKILSSLLPGFLYFHMRVYVTYLTWNEHARQECDLKQNLLNYQNQKVNLRQLF